MTDAVQDEVKAWQSRNRGVKEVFIACVDWLKGFPQAIEAVFLPVGGRAPAWSFRGWEVGAVVPLFLPHCGAGHRWGWQASVSLASARRDLYAIDLPPDTAFRVNFVRFF